MRLSIESRISSSFVMMGSLDAFLTDEIFFPAMESESEKTKEQMSSWVGEERNSLGSWDVKKHLSVSLWRGLVARRETRELVQAVCVEWVSVS